MRIENVEYKERINNKTAMRVCWLRTHISPALPSPLHENRYKHVGTHGSCVRLNNRIKKQKQDVRPLKQPNETTKQSRYAIVPAQSTLKQGEITNQQLANGFEK